MRTHTTSVRQYNSRFNRKGDRTGDRDEQILIACIIFVRGFQILPSSPDEGDIFLLRHDKFSAYSHLTFLQPLFAVLSYVKGNMKAL